MTTIRSRRFARLAAVAATAVAAIGLGASSASAMTPPQTTETGVVNLVAGTSSGSITNFWATTMSAWGKAYSRPSIYYYNHNGSGFPMTECGRASVNNSFYCYGSNHIYLDYNWNQGLLNRFGDMAPAGILAHEWGHDIQDWLGYHDNTYRQEYHADCLAGMYVRYGYAAGRLNGTDYGEFYNWFLSQGYDITHGRGTNRAAWYQYGYTQYSLAACNQAYSLPITPAKAGTTSGTSQGTGASTVGVSSFEISGLRPTPAPPVKVAVAGSGKQVALPSLTGHTLSTLPAALR